ncbi:MAG: hypothetical protein MUC49_14190 [Raineya sp.]|jgi:hypothetical protein|nr:hypothetical protein [Raineya sp.]
MKNIKYILSAGVVATLVFSCKPEYPEPQANKALVAPLVKTNANNARIMVFNALVDLSPDENNPQSRFEIVLDGTPLTNFDGTPAVVFSNQFRLDGATVIPLVRKYPSAVATPIGITGALEQSSQYIPVANSGFAVSATAFTNFAAAVPASTLNGVELTPAQQERGMFIPAGRRDIAFSDATGTLLGALRVNTNLNAGSLTSVFLRGKLGTTTGSDAQGATTITETIPTPTGAAIRFLNLASDLSEVQLLTADASSPSPFNVSRRPMIVFPNAPTNTRYSLDQGKTPAQQDSLRATRDSLASRRRYNVLTNTISASSARQISVERTSDGTAIPNYTQALTFSNYTNIPAGTFLFNFYNVNRRHTAAIVAKNIGFNFLAGGVYTIVLHGSAQEGYKCDIIRMN